MGGVVMQGEDSLDSKIKRAIKVKPNGAVTVSVDLGVEVFKTSNVSVAPLAVAAQSFVVPAGCYSVTLEPFNTTIDTFTAFVGYTGFNVGATIAAALTPLTDDVIFVEQGSEPVTIGVNPGDVVYFRGCTSVAGQIHVTFNG